MSFLTDCASLPAHVEQRCNDFKKGGAPSFAIVNKNSTVVGDWANSTKWLSEIGTGNIQVANRVKFSIPEPTPSKIDNPVANGATQILDGFEWKIEGVDAHVNTINHDFYKSLNSVDSYVVLWNEEEGQIIVIDKPVTWTSFPIFTASNKEFQTYKVEGEFSSGKDWFWSIYTEPTGVFEL